MWSKLEPLLDQVQKPARYIGGEGGMAAPSHDPSRVAWLLTYPDTYEVGLPNQGLQILYEILNERRDAVAERTYAPWIDLEAEMRTHGLPLFSGQFHFDTVGVRRSQFHTQDLGFLAIGNQRWQVPIASPEVRDQAELHFRAGLLRCQCARGRSQRPNR